MAWEGLGELNNLLRRISAPKSMNLVNLQLFSKKRALQIHPGAVSVAEFPSGQANPNTSSTGQVTYTKPVFTGITVGIKAQHYFVVTGIPSDTLISLAILLH